MYQSTIMFGTGRKEGIGSLMDWWTDEVASDQVAELRSDRKLRAGVME